MKNPKITTPELLTKLEDTRSVATREEDGGFIGLFIYPITKELLKSPLYDTREEALKSVTEEWQRIWETVPE